jgi:hypothetical protein
VIELDVDNSSMATAEPGAVAGADAAWGSWPA